MDPVAIIDLPLPRRDMVPRTLEEKIICCADKFYSKTGPAHARLFSRWATQLRL